MTKGYSYLIQAISAAQTKASSAATDVQRGTPGAKAHSKDLLAHVLFAMQQEGINLAVLSQVLPRIEACAFKEILDSQPVNANVYRVGFLWEFFNAKKLPNVTPARDPIGLFDPKVYYTGPAEHNSRWNLLINGLGPLTFCPTIRRTALINQYLGENFTAQLQSWTESQGTLLPQRLNLGARSDELQASFALEGIKLTISERERLTHDLASIDHEDTAQSLTAVLAVFSQVKQASSEKILSQKKHPVVPPVFCSLVEQWAPHLDPVFAAAIVGFGWSYLTSHSLAAGCTSRWLMSKELGRNGVELPISWALQKDQQGYSQVLEARTESTLVSAKYCYWDATQQAEKMIGWAKAAAHHVREEAQYVKSFDHIAQEVDARFDVRESVLIDLVQQALKNKGSLSSATRRAYAAKVEPEVVTFLETTAQKTLARMF